MKDTIKNIIIIILLALVIILLYFVIFYNKLSFNKVIPTVKEFSLSEEMQQSIQEEELETAEEVVITYNLDNSDLKKYEKNDENEYTKGKQNPFDAVSADAESGDTTNSTTNNTITTNFYKDTGTK